MTASQTGRPAEVLLQVEDLHVAYGKAEVVHGVSLDVRRGEFVVILGRNGAGKSTVLHAISGLIPKRAGRVQFAGRDMTHLPARDIVKAGVVQVLEGHRVFHSLSVEDNLLIGTYAHAPRGDHVGRIRRHPARRREPVHGHRPSRGRRRRAMPTARC